MVRFLIRTAVNLASAALGLLIAAWIVSGFGLQVGGFLTAVVVFAVAQAILTPFVFNMARQYAAPILGGIGLVSTFVAIVIASLFPGGLQISGITAWVVGTLVVWIVNALGGWILAVLFIKKQVVKKR